MRVRDVMTPDPACCTPESTAAEAAILMRDNDCGSIPVVQDRSSLRVVGTVTDRDLAIRVLAEGKGGDTTVRQIMTEGPTTALPEDEVEVVREVMIAQQVRRVPGGDENGGLGGDGGPAGIAPEEGAGSDQGVGP